MKSVLLPAARLHAFALLAILSLTTSTAGLANGDPRPTHFLPRSLLQESAPANSLELDAAEKDAVLANADVQSSEVRMCSFELKI